MTELRSSRAMVERITQGDAAAVGELLERHLSGLHAFVRLNCGEMLGRKESHADLVQSTCREFLEQLQDFDFRGEAEFKSWLYTTALNKIRKKVRHHRTEKRDVAREADAYPADKEPLMKIVAAYGFGTPSEGAIARESARRIEAVFAELSEVQRRVVTLIRICGLDHPRTAAEVGLTEAASRKTYARAAAKIILALKD